MRNHSAGWRSWWPVLALGWISLTLAAQAQSFGAAVQYSAASNGSLYAVALGDVNGDGRPDIVTVDFVQDNVLVLSGQAGGSFGAASSYTNTMGGAPTSVAVGDVTGDGIADVVVGNTFQNNLGVLPGRTTGGPGPLTTYSTSVAGASSTPRGVAIGDVNNDGRPDLVAALDVTNAAGVLLGQVGGGFAPLSAYSVGAGASPYAVALSDLNGDGRLDIITANRTTNSVAVLLGQASGGFGAASTYSAGATGATDDVAAGDLNGDGRPDIVVSTSTNAGVLLALASGGFAPVVTYPTGANVKSVALGDVTGDGRLDLITTGEAIVNLSVRGSVAVLPGQAGGTFGAAQSFTISSVVGAGPIDAALRDLNGDGRLDIVTANYNPGTVSVLLNTGTYLAASASTLAETAIYPNPVAVPHCFTVRLPAAFQSPTTRAELRNQLGQVVGELAVGPSTSLAIETAGLAPGSYFLQLTAPTGVIWRRIILR